MKMLDQMLFHQPPGDLFEIILQLELIHQLHADEILCLHLHRQAATGSTAVITESLAVFCPGCEIINICLPGR